jgi:ribA/ribD-fused uncharacterized protein
MNASGQEHAYRTYHKEQVCFFRKTKEQFGGLSNMAAGYPLYVNGLTIYSSEALYQACKFPYLPHLQEKVLRETSPMSAKMVTKPYQNNIRPDWDKIKVQVMYWCLRVKLAQNFAKFGLLLESTGNRPIVEESNKDPFWGAMPQKTDKNMLVGINALGRLLMKLREEYNSESRYKLLIVPPPIVSDFLLRDSPITLIDVRTNFIREHLSQHIIDHEQPNIENSLTTKKGVSYFQGSYSMKTTIVEEEGPHINAKKKGLKTVEGKKALNKKKGRDSNQQKLL